ncbi:MAG: four helix bundle protein [Opitutaceae bacterium]
MCERTMQFALRVMRLVDELPGTPAGRNVGGQLVRSSSSVASNYRAAQRARSHADFSNKIGIVLEEADESGFWLELIERGSLLPAERLKSLQLEADELTAIFVSMKKTARSDRR